MAILNTLARLPGRILRQLVRKNTSEIMAVNGNGFDAAPDMRGYELTVVSSDLGPEKVRSLIEGPIPRRLWREFFATIARGPHLYMLFKNGRLEHYNWVGMTEPHQALFVAGPDDAVGFNGWTIREARGKGLFGLSMNLQGWHMKQQGYRRVVGAAEVWNAPSRKGMQRGGLEYLGRYTLWTLLGGAVFFRIEHAARGRARYRFFFGLDRRNAPKLRHPEALPEPGPGVT